MLQDGLHFTLLLFMVIFEYVTLWIVENKTPHTNNSVFLLYLATKCKHMDTSESILKKHFPGTSRDLFRSLFEKKDLQKIKNKKGIETIPFLFVQEMPLVWLAKPANFDIPLSLIYHLANGSLACLRDNFLDNYGITPIKVL